MGKSLDINLLIEKAKQARLKAYCPYSHYQVGAAVLAGSGKIYLGCNVENSAYGSTLDAEQVAVSKAISEGEKEIVAVAVVTDSIKPASPCGACRQIIGEFGKDIKIIRANLRGDVKIETIGVLLPGAFTGEALEQRDSGG